jgi:glycosyltransferase involved in cell wall biosynthesis
LVRYGIAPQEKINVLYLGLDLSKFTRKARGEGTLRQELKLPSVAPLVGIVARIVPIKNFPLFLNAAKIVLSSLPEAHFVIVGDGELRTGLEGESVRLGLQKHVHFLGFRKDLENIYPDLDVLVLTSANEGSPVSLIEGLASGCAVVATAVGGVPDVVQEGLTGLLVDIKGKSQQGIAQEFASRMIQLLKDPSRRKALGELGRKDILARFGIERLVADLDGLYTQIAAQKVL